MKRLGSMKEKSVGGRTEAVFCKAPNILGADGEKSRGYSRKVLAVVTEQQHKRTTLGDGLGKPF